MENKNNEAAFPREWSSSKQNKDAPNQYSVAQKGLTKREYFAGIAMNSYKYWILNPSKKEIENYAELCVQVADEILKQLNKPISTTED